MHFVRYKFPFSIPVIALVVYVIYVVKLIYCVKCKMSLKLCILNLFVSRKLPVKL